MQSERVWDIYVRIFHWTLVFSMIGLYVTGEDLESAHTVLGYLVICLVVSRIMWGFVGTRHARFKDFVYRPGEIYRYLKGLLNADPIHYTGHNPAGGFMVIAMLLALLITLFTGLKTLGSEGKGPLADTGISVLRSAHADEAGDDDDDHTDKTDHRQKNRENEFWEEVHEALTGFMIFLIVVHIAGVIVSSWAHRENLILAMITGRKKIRMIK